MDHKPIPMTSNRHAYEIDIPNPPGVCNPVKEGGMWIFTTT